VLPLALDDSGDPAQAQRAAQKLLVDPTVRAVVGPLLLDNIPTVTTVITPESGIPWYIPALVTPNAGFASPASAAWLDAQIDYIANNTAAKRVLLFGLPSQWQLPIQSQTSFVRIDTLATALSAASDGDALLWLGPPDVGARWLAALRQTRPQITFWLAPQAGIDIFAAHNTDRNNVHWLLWHNPGYNRWSQSDGSVMSPSDETRYLTYRATCLALSGLSATGSAASQPNDTTSWELQNHSLP
jgi:branched-chain amino acid transport system substrate-binding protein